MASSAASVLLPGTPIAPRTLHSITGAAVPIPDPQAIVHLQFRRFAACPICSVHLRAFSTRQGELHAAGIREVVAFHSSTEALGQYRSDLPFDVIADPDRALYAEFGVGRGVRYATHPRAAVAGIRGLGTGASLRGALDRREDHFGQPADFLITGAGVLAAVHYGTHAADGWSVDEVLSQARSLS